MTSSPQRRAYLALHRNEELFAQGLRAAGFGILRSEDFRPGDVVVTWNRLIRNRSLCHKAERAGARVLVIENGYTGAFTDDPFRPDKLFAIALDHHAGAGAFTIGTEPRWRGQGLEPAPWRLDGWHVLVLAQRGIGEQGIAMPRGWPEEAAKRLKARTDRPVKIRSHPGRNPNPVPLEQDLKNAWCAVTWGSGAAVKALLAGVPVFHALPGWIGAQAARPFGHDLEDPFLGDRTAMLQRLGFAQWTKAEILEGRPFQCLPT